MQRKNREFDFSTNDFKRVVALINKKSGIHLSDHKSDMVYSRLARRIRQVGLRDFDSYLELVENDNEESINFTNALTTNLTHFFREKHHFEYLANVYYKELFAKKKKRIRVWSAGCSTGEEPYTLAMVWNMLPNKPAGVDFKILATDLDTKVLDACRRGIYVEEKLEPIDEKYKKWFKQTKNCKSREWEINPKLRELIFFKHLNLMNEWPMKGPLDLIICRNVLIYFDKETQQNLVKRFSNLLSDDGCLILGHSENLSANKIIFNAIGKTIFRKVA
ncbi:CheR family methyltransferase [Aliikangiella sp. IMCC44359]|uniref:CheR family methyltransferase n=1 Tax=Aliikangiella sp. IMCC44359 TaxID=3459125 RepID=UPI00403B0268